jgi:hypothetical protein
LIQIKVIASTRAALLCLKSLTLRRLATFLRSASFKCVAHMFETLFGAEMPLAVRFFLAFIILLFLVGVVAYLARLSLLRLTASRAASEGAKDVERSISACSQNL